MTTPKERELEARIKKLEDQLNNLQSIPQVSSIATINDIILVINKITNSIKRRK